MRDKTKTRKIVVWATPDEFEEVCRRADEAGIKYFSVYMLRMALYGYIVHIDMTDVNEILRLVSISSNNINQYARRANQDGSIFARDIEDVQNSQQRIICLLGELLDRLGRLEE